MNYKNNVVVGMSYVDALKVKRGQSVHILAFAKLLESTTQAYLNFNLFRGPGYDFELQPALMA